MRLRFASSYPTMTAEQARNAITIAQVARDLQIPRYGLQIAIATAIQESKLVNLTGGDRDSGGLFQQRPSTGWGSRAEITNPGPRRACLLRPRPSTPATPACSTSPAGRTCRSPRPRRPSSARATPTPTPSGRTSPATSPTCSAATCPTCPTTAPTTNVANCQGDTVNPITVGTLNLLGAGHTDKAGRSGPGTTPGTSGCPAPCARSRTPASRSPASRRSTARRPRPWPTSTRPSGACTRPPGRPRTG